MYIPAATYRLQFNASFEFKSAHDILLYLTRLGITDIYASPIFKTRKGSTHGYDITDLNKINPELGGSAGFDKLAKELQKYRLGWIQDIVPNHMAFDYENVMLTDILENGENSRFYHFFDIEWNHSYESIKGRILAPFLGRFYGESLENKEIQLKYDENGFYIGYYDLRFPLKIESYTDVLVHKLSGLKKKLGGTHPEMIKLLGILYVLHNLSFQEERNERYNQVTFIKKMLWELHKTNEDIKKYINETVNEYNGKKGVPESFNLLEKLLSKQLYRLSYWKVATEEINFRRFFGINDLISLRMENEEVFNYTHSLILNFLNSGKFSGLRIDHVDGLYDPQDYLNKLRKKSGSVYIITEKILDLDEELKTTWPVQGTTGYKFLNILNMVFCKKENEKQFQKIYSKFTGLKDSYVNMITEKKRLIIGKHMAGDIDNLAHLIKGISNRYRHGSDITLYGIKRALVEIMAQFPVYRTYIHNKNISNSDIQYITQSVSRAQKIIPEFIHELNFIEEFTLLKFKDYLDDEEREKWIHFVMKFQQYTGPLMAKGFEDTFLYIFNRFISHNEVGGNPGKFAVSVEEFHDFNKRRIHAWPHSLNATSTHDTKRGEDVRARLNVLSEIPQQWESNVKYWRKINRGKKKKIRGSYCPDKNDEYFLYQTIIGTFPWNDSEYSKYIERIKNYIIKAVREAKIHTAWLKHDAEYEATFISFIDRILKHNNNNRFLNEFIPFQKTIAYYGIFNSLSQLLLKITTPGIPDFYQGTELWDFNLVDPDNRRPVDFGVREKLLKEIIEAYKKNGLQCITELLSSMENGKIKLFLTYILLSTRKKMNTLFLKGTYLPLTIEGQYASKIIAFARSYNKKWLITVAPRFLTDLINEGELPVGYNVWKDTHIVIPENFPSRWRNSVTSQEIHSGASLPAGLVFERFPAALLINEEA